MGRFDDFVDEFVFMAKNAADVASKKTGEVVEISKLKYQIKQIEWDVEKAYAKLGALVYESKRSAEDLSDAIRLATAEIDELNLKADHLEEKLREYKKVKKCAECEKDNDMTSYFCVRCGAPLESGPVEAEAEPVDVSEPINENDDAGL